MTPAVYVHVPFCGSKCSYCNFYSLTSGDSSLWLSALAIELRLRPLAPAPSVYIGGGTPSCLPAGQLARLLQLLSPAVGEGCEVSIECNPEDLDSNLLSLLGEGGVTRVSLGVQSLQDEELTQSGRRHSAVQALGAMDLVAASSLDLAADLIIGLPGQEEADFRRSLDLVLERDPQHLSLYCLELDEPVPMVGLFDRQPGLKPADDLVADLYLAAHDKLAARGYDHYEVSNWARAGKRCRYNEQIWRSGGYVGLGPSAHSHLGGRRWAWPPDLTAWSRLLEANSLPSPIEDGREANARILEKLLLALRTSDGLPEDDPHLAANPDFRLAVERQGWARVEKGRWVLRPSGWLRLDGIVSRLAGSEQARAT